MYANAKFEGRRIFELRINSDAGNGDVLYFIRKDEILGSAFADLRIISSKRSEFIRTPAILQHISAGLRTISCKRIQFIRKCEIAGRRIFELRIKSDAGDGDVLYFIRKDEILRSAFADLRINSSKRSEFIRTPAILQHISAGLRIISSKKI